MVYDKATDEFKSIDELSNDDEEDAEGKLRDEDDVVELTMPEPPQPASATLLAHSSPMPTLELKRIRDYLREAKHFLPQLRQHSLTVVLLAVLLAVLVLLAVAVLLAVLVLLTVAGSGLRKVMASSCRKM